ncbi:type IV secretory system conjugative DNA transfer family protein [Solihabitans fulvus]|uniref:type IV secretory system conjugative DNA transfer family protein n=1 Tax=Solihabitans fulvus TaxID=1892852 RepID=UPI001661FB65|nr:type IV secretory system conjugative DNA transfer family protein [Solihabitans fulvus]
MTAGLRHHGGDRQVVRQVTGETLGGIACATVVVLGVITAGSGQLAAVLTGRGWPRWHGLGLNVAGPVFGVYAHPADPMRHWPGLPADTPSALVYWLVFAVLLAVPVAGVIAVARVVQGGRSRPGFAARRDVAARLGTTALLAQAPRLRPQLARTTPRPLPEQVGTRLGRDVNTGVECWSSVRQSKYVVGPSESGKTSCVVIPEALDHDGPLLAPSSRADVMAATWKARAETGTVLLFDPLKQAAGLPLVRWDPVRACVDPDVAMRRAQALMSSVDMSAVSNGDAWKNRGQAVLRNLLHAAALTHRDIRGVLRWTYDQTSVEPAAILERSPVTPDNWAEMQFSVINTPERQRAGYYMAVEGAMEVFTHQRVLETCLPGTGQQFDPHAFLDPATGHATLYLLSQRAQTVAVSDLLAALMEEIIDAARRGGQGAENNRLDPPLRLLADEAPNTATLRQLPDLISDGGGRGIPTTMVVQDRAQAAARWGREDAASMWGAATVRLVLPGVAGFDDMREIAAYAGEFDEQVSSLTRGGGSGRSEQLSLRSRAGLTPAEVRGIPAFHALVLAAGGLLPVETELQPYFQRPDAGVSAAAEREFYDALREGRSVS